MSQSSIKKTGPQPWEKFDEDLTDAHVSLVPPQEEAAIEGALELQMISIRLQKSLITNLKIIADFHKIGYQPLIRDLLNRFVRSEVPIIIKEMIEQKKALLEKMQEDAKQQDEAASQIVDGFLSRAKGKKVA